MVGIILASHGGFADGIYQSGEMIFGKQENVAHVILKPDEGPDDVRAKMEKAIESFDNQDEILFLVDLWEELLSIKQTTWLNNTKISGQLLQV